MEPCTFQPKLRKLHDDKISYTSENGNPETLTHFSPINGHSKKRHL